MLEPLSDIIYDNLFSLKVNDILLKIKQKICIKNIFISIILEEGRGGIGGGRGGGGDGGAFSCTLSMSFYSCFYSSILIV